MRGKFFVITFKIMGKVYLTGYCLVTLSYAKYCQNELKATICWPTKRELCLTWSWWVYTVHFHLCVYIVILSFFFSSPKCTDGVWGPPSLLCDGFLALSGWNVKLTIHLDLIQKLEMRGVRPLFPLHVFIVCTGTALLLPLHSVCLV